MKVDLLDAAVIAAGVVGVVAGILAWTGRYQSWLRWYDDAELPFFMRGAGLTGIPLGIGFSLLGLAVAIASLGESWIVWSMLCAAASSTLGLVAVLLAWFQPAWSKPRWLTERDRDHSPPQSSDADRGLMMLLVTLFGGATLFFVFVAVVTSL